MKRSTDHVFGHDQTDEKTQPNAKIEKLINLKASVDLIKAALKRIIKLVYWLARS